MLTPSTLPYPSRWMTQTSGFQTAELGRVDAGGGGTIASGVRAELGGLEADACVIHHATDEGNVLASASLSQTS